MRSSPRFRRHDMSPGRILSVTAVIALLVGGPWSDLRAQRPGGPGAVVFDSVVLGRVIDGDSGRPVAGAVVTLNAPQMRQGNGPPQSSIPQAGGRGPVTAQLRAITNGDGQFVFRDLGPGRVQITATMTGYLNGGYGRQRPNAPTRPLTLGERDTRADVEIRLWRYSSISGMVVDEVGEPVVGARVVALLRVMLGGVATLRPGVNTQTDDRGRYRLSRLVPGQYVVAVPSSTTSLQQATIDEYYGLSPGDRSALTRERRGSGAPSPTAGMPLGDTGLVITSSGALPPPMPVDGRLNVLRTIFHPSSPSVTDAGVIDVGSGQNIDGRDVHLQLTSAVTVSGQVFGVDGAPVQGLGLRLILAEPGTLDAEEVLEAGKTASGPGGRFVFAGVPPGNYQLKVLNAPPQPTRAAPQAGFAVVNGIVSPTGAAPPPPPPPPPPVSAPGLPLSWAEMPVAVGGTDVTGLAVTLRPGLSLSGRFEFVGASPPPTPEEIRRISVRLEPIDRRTGSASRGQSVDAEDGFRMSGHLPGRYLVTAATSARNWTMESITIGNRSAHLDPVLLDTDVDGVVIRFTDDRRSTMLKGPVQAPTDRDGTIDVLVVAFPADYRAWIRDGMSIRRMPTTQTFAPVYTLNRVPPGDYLVAAIDSGDVTDLQNPDYFERLAPLATRISFAAGEQKSLPLIAVVVR